MEITRIDITIKKNGKVTETRTLSLNEEELENVNSFFDKLRQKREAIKEKIKKSYETHR